MGYQDTTVPSAVQSSTVPKNMRYLSSVSCDAGLDDLNGTAHELLSKSVAEAVRFRRLGKSLTASRGEQCRPVIGLVGV
ncbi:hypothetical protein MTY59_35710 [Mycobacterium senriense]|uniref:Uncharacterized protein n=1 Tax=Mycobacterium senriense TaxID=2775496 RepID=A0ABM7SR07_9MYCO|nr:hypothetical protein MTY59_35710 [Mycobacterium senriense]